MSQVITEVGASHAARRNVLAAASTVAIAAAVARLLGAGKELAVAFSFGTGLQLDAFLIALIVPATLMSMLSGALQSSLLPAYVDTRVSRGEARARALLESAMFCTLVALAGVSLVMVALAPALLRLVGGDVVGGLPLTRSLFILLAPLPLMAAYAAVWSAALNAHDRYTTPAIAPGLTAIVVTAAVLLVAGRIGVYSLAAGTLIGMAAELSVLGWSARRLALPLLPGWHGWTPELRQVIRQYLPVVGGTLLMTSTMLVDQGMAARLGSGNVSTLAYGTRFAGFTIGIASLALGTAVFPHFARSAVKGHHADARDLLYSYSRTILLIGIPAVLLVALLSEPIIGLLFERGAFTAADTRAAARVQALYIGHVPFYLIGIIGVRLLSSLKLNQWLLAVSAVNVVLNIIGNLVLMRYFGVAGIALSTTIVYIIACALIVWLAARATEAAVCRS